MPPSANIRHLSVLSYANGFTLWHYNALGAGHARWQVEQPGFFDSAADTLDMGNMILLTFVGEGAVRFVKETRPSVVLVPLT